MSAQFSVSEIDANKKHYEVIIIGAGQAGLSMAHCLQKKGIDYLILEQSNCVAHNWRHERWDKFCLVTPNWQCQLPGFPYQGNDPNGFMVKHEIIDYLESYYESFLPPIKFHTSVKSLSKHDETFYIETSNRHFTCDEVVVACGSYHKPNILPAAKSMPKNIVHIHSRDYKNPKSLPKGDVMIVGTGQSGCQIAEDLHYYKTTIGEHPQGENAPHATNHYVTGRDGGRDLNLRIFAEQGMKLYGKLSNVNNGFVSFHDDLVENLDNADAVAERINQSIEDYIQNNNIDAPKDNNVYSNYVPSSSCNLDMNVSEISCVIWATGFNTHFDWIKLPVLDKRNRVKQKRGISEIQGLYFLGLNWMHTWGSGRFYHVGRDAEFLSSKVCATDKALSTAMV